MTFFHLEHNKVQVSHTCIESCPLVFGSWKVQSTTQPRLPAFADQPIGPLHPFTNICLVSLVHT